MESSSGRAAPRIYNLFPLLAGPFTRWTPHLERARAMDFNWIFINPFHRTGYSRSLYSIADYYAYEPRLIDQNGGPPEAQLRHAIEVARSLGMHVMMDLVINHTAFDSPLVSMHPAWYKRGADGKPVHPGTRDGDRVVTWGDLLEIDNSVDRDGLWRYWSELALHYAAMGIEGFRCDAAYKVSADLWRNLIGTVKRANPEAQFFAESLGCPFEDTIKLARSGFDFIFNSSKWWDFAAPWCLLQYQQTAPLVPSVSFPESHDTERLAAELAGDRDAVKMRYAFAATFSSGVMIPIGFEYGFRRRLDVVKTSTADWETPSWDITEFIGNVNRLKKTRRLFEEEGPIEPFALENPKVVALAKWSLDRRERALIVLNKDRRSQQTVRLQRLAQFLASTVRFEDISPDDKLDHSPDFQTCFLKPSGAYVLWAQGA
jgi:starch synthase (maltosyl-transferring)